MRLVMETGIVGLMPHKMRVEYLVAINHGMSRRDYREGIFLDGE